MSKDDLYKSEAWGGPICSFPWTTLVVDPQGVISLCCHAHPIANVREVSEKAIDEIWNSKIAQDLRRRWIKGRLEGTYCCDCPALKRFKKYEHPTKNIPNLSDKTHSPFFSNAELNLEEYSQGKTILKSKPVSIIYIPSVLCNIRCSFCFQPVIGKGGAYIKTEILLKFYHYLGSMAIRNFFSGGEPFYINQTYRLLDEFSPEHKAAAEAIFQTNGLLIKDKFDLISGFRRYGFRISIAAFEKKRFEHLQKGASFEILINNLEFLDKRRSEGMDITMTLIMILMKSNFTELERIFDFAKTYRFDEVWVTPVFEPHWEGASLTSENIFEYPYLLWRIFGWKDILARASQKAIATGDKLTYYHLEYIRERLSLSNRHRLMRRLFQRNLRKLRRAILLVLSLPVGLFLPARRREICLGWDRLGAVLRNRIFKKTR